MLSQIDYEYELMLLKERKRLQEQIQNINVELADLGIKKLQQMEKQYQAMMNQN